MLMQINKLYGVDRLVIKASSLWDLQNSAIHFYKRKYFFNPIYIYIYMCVCVSIYTVLQMRKKLFFVFHYLIVVSNNLFQAIKLYIILLTFLQKGILKSPIHFENRVILLLFVIGNASLTKVDTIV
jgi:hypothetical protein